MKATKLNAPAKIVIDLDCEACQSALESILRNKTRYLVLVPDFNSSGRITHHHVEAEELSDEQIGAFTRKRDIAELGDAFAELSDNFCKICDGKCQLS